MSIKVMTMVFDRYPEGGNERLLALALADHARDDGTRIWPSVAELSRKTLQHRSTVQRQLARMVERGWLELVHKATGRPGDTNEYRINAAWIDGAELPETGSKLRPLSDAGSAAESVDNVIHTGRVASERGRVASETGSTAMRPESSGTVMNQYPLTPVGTGDCGKPQKTDNREPNAKSGRAPKPPWRWQDSFDGICKRGEQLGHVYSTVALGSAWTEEQLLRHQRAYRELVQSAHDAQERAPPRPLRTRGDAARA